MLTISDFQILRRAYHAHDELTLNQAWAQIGNPPVDLLVQDAVELMSSPDRNSRVLALRILRHQQGAAAVHGIITGLKDHKRRVRAVAIQACPNYLADPAVVEGLESIVTDCRLKRKLRRRALRMMAGNEGQSRGDLTTPQVAALRRLKRTDEHRFAILFGLARLDLAPQIILLLVDFARSHDTRASDMARRALAGERVIHIDACASDEALQRRIIQTCQLARGRMFYWLPRADWPMKAL